MFHEHIITHSNQSVTVGRPINEGVVPRVGRARLADRLVQLVEKRLHLAARPLQRVLLQLRGGRRLRGVLLQQVGVQDRVVRLHVAEVAGVGLVGAGVVDARVGERHAGAVHRRQRRRPTVEPRTQFVGGRALRVVVHQVDQPLWQPQRRAALGRRVRRRRRLGARGAWRRVAHAEDGQDDGQREHRQAAAGADHDECDAFGLQPLVVLPAGRLKRRPETTYGRRRAGRRRPQRHVIRWSR